MKVHIICFYLNNLILIFLLVIIITFSSVFATYCFSVSKIIFNNNNSDGIKVPIIMYHSVLKSKCSKYIVNYSSLEDDLKYLKRNNFVTINMSDLINYVYNNESLPNKPIMLTFDDGFYNNLEYVVPLLHKYNMKAVISIIGSLTDNYTNSDEANANYSYLRWKDINYLIKDGSIEFANHTYDMHNQKHGRKGCMKKYFESTDKYCSVLSNDVNSLQNKFLEHCGYTPNTFTYPFGAVSKDSLDIVKSLGFKASLSCAEGINYINNNPECLYLLKRYNRSGKYNTIDFFKKIKIN